MVVLNPEMMHSW